MDCIAALMTTPTPTQLYQTNDTAGSGIATMMVQEEVLTTQVSQSNDGGNTISSCIIHNSTMSKDTFMHAPDCIAATMIQTDVSTTQAPTQAPQINDGSDIVYTFNYR